MKIRWASAGLNHVYDNNGQHRYTIRRELHGSGYCVDTAEGNVRFNRKWQAIEFCKRELGEKND